LPGFRKKGRFDEFTKGGSEHQKTLFSSKNKGVLTESPSGGCVF
jgi:hypothetical protein